MPDARLAPIASRAKRKNTRAKSPQVRRKRPGIPCASGFNGFLRALPGEPGFVATIACKVIASTGLTSASGCQDHTTSPSAISSAFVLCASRVHRIPHPTFVTIAKRPSLQSTGQRNGRCDLVFRSTATDWHDGQISVGAGNRVKSFLRVLDRLTLSFQRAHWRETGNSENPGNIQNLETRFYVPCNQE
jgi:hypothetical protein